MGVIESRELRIMSGPKKDEVTGGRKKYTLKGFIICVLHLRYLELLNKKR
jgi:hypothetical protein